MLKRILAISSATVFAATAGEPLKTIAPPKAEPPLWKTYYQAEAAHAFDARYEGVATGLADKGRGSATHSRFQLGIMRHVAIPLLADKGGHWRLRLGADYERFDFGHDSALPLPGQLQRVAAVFALEYRLAGQTGVLLEARPGVHFSDDVTSDAWNCPILAGVGIPLTDRFALALAARVDPLAKYPVIGGPGFVWKISDTFKIAAVPPEPRIIWQASEQLELWLGGEFVGGAFRAGKVNDPELDGTIVSYVDQRASLGVTWSSDEWFIEASAGVSFEREWDYHRADRRFSTDAVSPQVKFAARREW